MEQQQNPNDDRRVAVGLLAKASFDKKWDILKPAIAQLYIEEKKELPDLIDAMKTRYNFTAIESQYKYHFKKWKFKKNISTPKKAAMMKIRQTRAKAGSTTIFEHQGVVVDKKLRRYMKDTMRRDAARQLTKNEEGGDFRILSGTAFLLCNNIFLNWSLPYGTMQSDKFRHPSTQISSPMSTSTPSDIVVKTPAANDAFSPNNAPSPLTRLQDHKESMERARMFIEGQHGALIGSMSREQRETMSKWLYEFWFFAFKTAKHWGRGPQQWNAEILRFNIHQATSPTHLPGTPKTGLEGSIQRQAHEGPLRNINPKDVEPLPTPSPLCRWTIHYQPSVEFEDWQSRTPSPEPDPDPLNEETWKPWPNTWCQPPIQEKLLNGIASNDFSSIKAEELPIAIPPVVKALEESNHGLLAEAFGFSIMARNEQMLDDLINRLDIILYKDKEAYQVAIKPTQSLNPVHIAISYLDGSKACCNVIRRLLPFGFRSSDVNNLGYTVFDNMMILILKAHSSVLPETVDDTLRGETRFPGEEVDICGRWDADSECFRALMASGDSAIPFQWKHKLCHTSAQAISHSMHLLHQQAENIGDHSVLRNPSGLFLKYCASCGMKMQLQPLHSLIITALQLANHGTKDEDLFGIVALLLCMLNLGANPLEVANVSRSTYSDEDESQSGCDHENIGPVKLATRIRTHFIKRWPKRIRTGWNMICCILKLSENEWQTSDLPLKIDVRGEQGHFGQSCSSFFGRDMNLKILHAAVQTELLTYRRLAEGDPWVSPHFNMDQALESLEKDGKVSIGLVEKNMMSPLRSCGHWREDGYCISFPRAEHVMKYYFSNLEDWARSTFIKDSVYDDWV